MKSKVELRYGMHANKRDLKEQMWATLFAPIGEEVVDMPKRGR